MKEKKKIMIEIADLLLIILILTLVVVIACKCHNLNKTSTTKLAGVPSTEVVNTAAITATATNPLTGPEIKTLWQAIIPSLNEWIQASKNITIPGGDSVSGTFDDMDLKDSVSGSGNQSVDVRVGTLYIDYNYRLKRILGLASGLKLDSTAIRIEPISNSKNQVITIFLTSKIPSLKGIVDLNVPQVSLNSVGLGVNAKCENSTLTLYNISIIGKLKITIIDCSKIENIQLGKLDINFERLEIDCDAKFDILPGLGFDIVNLGKYIADPIRNALPKLTGVLNNLLRTFNPKIFIPCIYIPPAEDTCLLGVDISSKNKLRTPFINGVDWNTCKKLCLDTQDCKYSFLSGGVSEPVGNCILFKNITKETNISGDYWNRATDTIVKGKIPGIGEGIALWPGQVSGLTAKECAQTCVASRDLGQLFRGCSAYRYSLDPSALKSNCELYSDATPQRLTLDLGKCTRNIFDPYTFV